jgi:hypothetical protein
MEICHNCGLPEGALRNPGRTASVTASAQFGDKRSRRHSGLVLHGRVCHSIVGYLEIREVVIPLANHSCSVPSDESA